MASAIHLARDGFVLDQGDADMLAEAAADFRKDPPSAAIFLNHGQPWKPGERLVQADLGRSLSLIAARAPRLSTRDRSPPGWSRRARLAAEFSHSRTSPNTRRASSSRSSAIIAATTSSPRRRRARAGWCCARRSTSWRAIRSASSASTRPPATHFLVEAMRRAYHDRNLNLGDPSFVKIDTAHFVDKGYAASLRAGIDPEPRDPLVAACPRRVSARRGGAPRISRSSTRTATRSR